MLRQPTKTAGKQAAQDGNTATACRKQKRKDWCWKNAPLYEVLLDMVIKHLPSPLEAQKYRIPKYGTANLETEFGKLKHSFDAVKRVKSDGFKKRDFSRWNKRLEEMIERINPGVDATGITWKFCRSYFRPSFKR
jgi:hypothetical protein